MLIKNVVGRQIFDSRGEPTVEVDVILEDCTIGTFSVPSGASTGENEALELRDGDSDYFGKGVIKAVNNVNGPLCKLLVGINVFDQHKIDDILIEADGTKNKSKYGANAILGISMACLKAAANCKRLPLFKYVGSGESIPIPMMNVINGGAHADNDLDFQEFMIIPQRDNIKDNMKIGIEVFHSLKSILKSRGEITSVGDEGGFAPNLNSNREALDLLNLAVLDAGYNVGVDVCYALDVAASTFYKDGLYHLNSEGKVFTSDELINYYKDLINSYPIISIEDPFYERDFDTLKHFTDSVGDTVQIVGDDYFVTNKNFLQRGIDIGAGTAILLKLNQIGTYSEFIDTVNLARRSGYNMIISHRSGETEDTTISDLAVGLCIGQIKTGSLSRSERVAKYNRLLRIDEQL